MRKSIIIGIVYLFLVARIVPAQVPMVEMDSTSCSTSWVERVENWYASNATYGAIISLMVIESSFIPFPSEVVIPPAVYIAAEESSALHTTNNYLVNVLLIILVGTLGAMIGAYINYFLAKWLGRPIIYAFADSKVGHLLLLSSEKVQRAEDYFNDYGKISTFVGRLIPAVRQLISIPAGLSRMPIGMFSLYTFLGAFSWNTVLALIGYIAHGQANIIHQYSHELSIGILGLLVIIIVVLIVRYFIKHHH